MNKIEGLVAAAFTPFYPDGSINKGIISCLVDKLADDGLKGIFVCGSNGEGPNMTTKERMIVAEEFVKAARKRLLVIIHVGHSSIAEAKLLSAHAAEIGADAFSSVAAFYFKPTSAQNLAHCMAEIAGAAPGLPFYYYHIPHLTGVSIDMVEFLQFACPIIPNLAGIKYTASTIHEFQACLNYENGKYDILFGKDEMLLPALSVGAKGAIGSTYTFAAPIYRRIIDHFNNGDFISAQENQYYMIRVIEALAKYPSIPAQKAILKMLGWDTGPSRLPLQTLNQESYEKFYKELNNLSFLERVPVRSK